MIELDEDALICDLAETYKIYDYRSLPLRTVATLAAGLRDDSRIKLRATGYPVAHNTILLAGIADRIDALRYSFADKEQPETLVSMLLGEAKTKKSGAMSFKTVEEFERAYARAKGD